MASLLSMSLTPAEVAFLCEMESVTIVPRQRLDSIELMGGSTPNLRPPHRADLPLWLAILLKRQRRADIVPPPWLSVANLEAILSDETSDRYRSAFSDSRFLPRYPQDDTPPAPTPPFAKDSTADAPSVDLPYHWLELAQTLLADASDDIPEAEGVRRLVRDLQEVRMSKVRAKTSTLTAGAGVKLNGLGAMEIAESRTFMTSVIDSLRAIGASREQADKERAEDDDGNLGGRDDDDEDEDML